MKIIDVPQSGKCGLFVSFQGRNGLIRRAWVVGSNPQTASQLTQRTILATEAQRFDALTTAQQDAWTAAAVNVQSRSRLGQSGPLTGLQLFTKLNCTLRTFGQAAIDAPSAQPQFPALAPANLVITNTGGVIALRLTTPADPGENTVVTGSTPQHSGVRSLPSQRVLGTVPAPVLGSSDITALYTARYGVPPVGTRIFVQCFQHQDGWQSLRSTFNAVVPATV